MRDKENHLGNYQHLCGFVCVRANQNDWRNDEILDCNPPPKKVFDCVNIQRGESEREKGKYGGGVGVTYDTTENWYQDLSECFYLRVYEKLVLKLLKTVKKIQISASSLLELRMFLVERIPRFSAA